jgi:N-acyl-L-homoserine lactone synthetase
MSTDRIVVTHEHDAVALVACARLRQRVFMRTYGPLGLRRWPGEPDAFDARSGAFVARENGTIVGTAVLHDELYDGTQPFWLEGFGIGLAELIVNPVGQRIGELGRVAVDKSVATRPLDVVNALVARVTAEIGARGIGPIVATAMSEPMLAFYADLARRGGGTLSVHPRTVGWEGITMTYMVLRFQERDYL